MFEISPHILFITSAAVLDGVATSQQVIFLVVLLGSRKPIYNSTAYIAGIVGAYVMCGLVGLLSIDQLNAFLKKFFPSLPEQQSPSYYQAQLVLGMVLVVVGINLFRKRKSSGGTSQNRLLNKLKNVNPTVAFLFGAFISSTSFPTALPYMGALEKLSTSTLGFTSQVGLLLYYNFIYILPTAIPFVIFLVLRKHSADIEKRIHFHAEWVNSFVSVLMFAGSGVYFVADSFCYMLFNHPIFKTRLF